MDTPEDFSKLAEVGIDARVPHAGPLRQHAT